MQEAIIFNCFAAFQLPEQFTSALAVIAKEILTIVAKTLRSFKAQ